MPELILVLATGVTSRTVWLFACNLSIYIPSYITNDWNLLKSLKGKIFLCLVITQTVHFFEQPSAVINQSVRLNRHMFMWLT